ncbi:hypothetical protein [Weissella cibaria]|nr:hypothetical protein [Weissella cibaria]
MQLLGVNSIFFTPNGVLGGNPSKFKAALNAALANINSSIQIDLDISNGNPRELQDYQYILVTDYASKWVDSHDFPNSQLVAISSSDFFRQ